VAAPTVLSVSPGVAETDVVLGTQIVVTFDQEIDAATLTESTFSLTGPAQQALTPGELSPSDPGQESVLGTFSFALDGSGRTVATFNPTLSLRKDTEYNVLLLGANSVLSADAILNAADEAMVESYAWTFKTGSLNVVVPPAPAPLPSQLSYIDTAQIVVIPRKVIGNDLAQEIQLIFPEELDPASVDLDALLVAIEPVLGDLSVVVPENLQATASVSGRKILITVTGW
jgi:hypothetical protein